MTMRTRPLNARSGFSLIELVVVLVIIGVLAAISVPTFRGVSTTAMGVALSQRSRNVQIAYLSLDSTGTGGLDAAPGSVPIALLGTLGEGHFAGEGGVELSVVGDAEDIWLRLEAKTTAARDVLRAFSSGGGLPHLGTTSVALVPLSGSAIELVDEIEALRVAEERIAAAAASGPDGAAATGTEVPVSGTGTEVETTGTDADRLTRSTVEMDESNTTHRARQSRSYCSPNLPPLKLKRCKAAAGLLGD